MAKLYFQSSAVNSGIPLTTKGRSITGGDIKKILITNYDDSTECKIKLFLDNDSGTTKILYSTVIPPLVSLILDDKDTLRHDSVNFKIKLQTFSDADLQILVIQ